MKNIKPTIVLSCICMAVALILSGINMVTGPIIEAQRAAAANGALLEVMPDGTNFEELDITTLGLPEAVIPLANCVCMLATAPKSNTAYTAYHLAADDIAAGYGVTVPEHLKSPEFKGYKYPHDYVNSYVHQNYLPKDLIGKKYYSFGQNKTEQAAKAYYEMITSTPDKLK